MLIRSICVVLLIISIINLTHDVINTNPITRAQAQQIWIVEGNATGKLTPNCSDLCVVVNTNTAQGSFPLNLQPCKGNSSTELWTYDPASGAIVSSSSSDSSLCIDAGSAPQLQLINCDRSLNQTWLWQNDTTWQVVSNATRQVFLGEKRQLSDWGTGKNNYSLSLDSNDGAADGDVTTVFTFLPYRSISLTDVRPALRYGVINNGGFERCGLDPGANFLTVDGTQLLYLCGWIVTENEIEYVSLNMWQAAEGNHSLHLNSAAIAAPGAMAQALAVSAGANYSLSFNIAGNPDYHCGSVNKTLLVHVSPSSMTAPQEIWFDASDAQTGQMGWQQVAPLGFTADADSVNLTFTSKTSGSCGPVIDNVTVVKIDGPLPPPGPRGYYAKLTSASSSGLPGYDKAIIVLSCAAAAIALVCGGFIICKRRKRQRRRTVALLVSTPAAPAAETKWWESLEVSALGGYNVDTWIRELTWQEIERATRGFTQIVGEGGFSTVYRADLGGGLVGAVKIEKTRDRSREAFKQELSILARLRHPNLVNLLGFCNEREEGILVFEYMAHGNLHERLHPAAREMYVPLTWRQRMQVALQVAQALTYLHEEARPPVVHGDIKGGNVLLDATDAAKLCDFGFAAKGGPNSSVFHSTVASVKGSLGYLDPHYLRSGRLSAKSDVYSYGVLLLELVSGLPAFDIHRAEALASFALTYLPQLMPEHGDNGDMASLLECLPVDSDAAMLELIVDSRLAAGEVRCSDLAAVSRLARMCIFEDPSARPAMSEVVEFLQRHVCFSAGVDKEWPVDQKMTPQAAPPASVVLSPSSSSSSSSQVFVPHHSSSSA